MEYKGISYNLKRKFENLKILTLANNKISKHELYFLSITNFPLLKILDLERKDEPSIIADIVSACINPFNCFEPIGESIILSAERKGSFTR